MLRGLISLSQPGHGREMSDLSRPNPWADLDRYFPCSQNLSEYFTSVHFIRLLFKLRPSKKLQQKFVISDVVNKSKFYTKHPAKFFAHLMVLRP